MGTEEEGSSVQDWSVFDEIRGAFSSAPETLMAEIDTAITKLEYERSTAHLDSSLRFSPELLLGVKDDESPEYDVRIADEAYRAGCASLAVGKLDEALQSLNISLSKCPPDKKSAVAKLQSLISLTSQQLHKT